MGVTYSLVCQSSQFDDISALSQLKKTLHPGLNLYIHGYEFIFYFSSGQDEGLGGKLSDDEVQIITGALGKRLCTLPLSHTDLGCWGCYKPV
jgi:hypothetical protein